MAPVTTPSGERPAGPDFRALVEQVPAIVYAATLDNRTIYVSPPIEAILGAPVERWTDDPDLWGRRMHPEDRAHVQAVFAQHRRSGTGFRCEYRLVREDGRVVWLLDDATVVRDPDGRPAGFQGVALDITERKAAEAQAAALSRELRTLHKISEIALADRPLEQLYREIVEEIAGATGFPMATITVYDEARDRLTYKAAHGLPDAVAAGDFSLAADEAFSGAVVRTGRPFVWSQAQPLPERLHAGFRTLGVQVLLAVPMVSEQRVIGTLGLADSQARPIDAGLVELAVSLANHVAALTERARAQQALRASERQFHAVFDAAQDAMLVIDDARTYVAANPAAARLFGEPVEALPGHRFGDFAAPGTEADGAWAALRDGRLATGEWVLRRRDGSERVVESTIAANFLPGQHLFVMRDLTERRQADAAARVRSAALTAAANGILITDAGGRIEWVNPEFTRMTGYTLDEVRGQTSRVLKSGRHDAGFYAQLWSTILAGRIWRGEITNQRKDGTLYHEEASITPVRADGADGPVTHFVAVKQDISERKRAEDHLRSSEEYYRSLIENALDLIVVVDADGTIRYASPSVQRILGHRPDDMVGTSALAQLHPDDAPAIAALFFGGQRAPGFTATAEYRFRHADGSWRTLEGVGSNLLHHPSVAGIIVNARDVTERRRDEATQERLREQLSHSEKLAAMGELLAGVAHELNNPLSVVIGHTALLARTADSAVATRADKIARAAERCGRIVKNFLSLARQYPPERTSVSLNQTVRDALEVMAYALRVDNVQVVTELEPDLPALSADGHQLQQVLVNLVTNAHQAMRDVERSRCVTIRTGVDPVAARAWLEIADTGPGIHPDVEARLFEPFFTTKPVGQGTGLGLSICRGIVEAHGGHVTVDGGFGRGATFRLELPVGGPAPATPAAEDEGPIVAPRRVLVVDDETEVAAVVGELLRRDGHAVSTAGNGVDALARMHEQRYDVVVSDIKMPHVDGPGLWRAVKQLDPELADRFVFFTGDTLSPQTIEFLERTGSPSVKKPFGLRDVRVALARVPPRPAAVTA
jgi:nitrogen fixation negative regulator NifL